MPCQPSEVHVVSHAHWDREWYQPFQAFRRRLVGTIDELLAIMEGDAEYRYFFLDAQTVVLEDYLAIRPENEPRLRALIGAGRIGVGPWYVQPDEALVSGEALIRNLLLGRRLAARYGAPAPRVGYVPDIFGHTGQLPQILAGFGIDNAFLWRGLSGEGYASELTWEGADGTRLLVAHFSDDWGYSDWYNCVRQPFLDGPVDEGRLVEAVRDYLAYKGERATVPVILAMDGSDHTEPDPRLPGWLALLNERLGGVRFIHSSPEQYLERLRAALHGEPQLVRGELREPAKIGAGSLLLNGVLSSRIRLKQENAACQALLEQWAEPMAALASLHAGQPYPRPYLAAAWRYLLQNQAHDSICGCSIDQVHEDMGYRFDQARLLAEDAAAEALAALAAGIGVGAGAPGDDLLVLFNPGADPLQETACVDLEFMAEPPILQRAGLDPNRYYIYVYGEDGQPLPVQLLNVSRGESRWARAHGGTPFEYAVDRFTVAMPVSVPPCGYASYTFERRDAPQRAEGSMAAGPGVWEGRHLRLSVNGNGSVNLLDKETGVEYRELLTWEDVGDVGDGWNHFFPVHDRRVTSAGARAAVSAECEGPLFTRLRIEWRLRVPAAAADELSRSEAEVELPITAWLDFPYDAREVRCRVRVENVARDHALRTLFPSGRAAAVFYTDSAFDLVTRGVPRPDRHDWQETIDEMVPQQSLVAVHDDRGGLAILSRGLPAVNVRDDGPRTIALQLVRGFARTVMQRGEEGGQSLGPHEFAFAISPFRATAGWQAGLLRRAAAFRAGWRRVQREVGRGPQPRRASLLSVEPAALQLSAFKAAEDEPGAFILRLYNPTDERVEGRVRLLRPPREARLANLDEAPGPAVQLEADGAIPIEAGPKKIVTLLLRWEGEGGGLR